MNMRYKLDDLGWLSFEHFCQILLKIKFGFGIEAWAGTGDWGRDAYYEGRLKYPSNTIEKGSFVFQCKFISNANAAGSKPYSAMKSAVVSEVKKIASHIDTGKWKKSPTHYIFLTNSRLAPTQRRELKKILLKAMAETEIHFHAGNDLCLWIDSNRDVLRSFPQLYTIRDIDELLQSVVNKKTLERSSEAIKYAKKKAKIFVETGAYSEAQETLAKESFVVLEGPPEMGKTTIGRVIALGQIEKGWTAYECRTPDEILNSYKKDTPQVFIADDFFGRTEYEPQRVSQWQSELTHILPKLDKDHWLILTCRAHLLEMGKSRLDVAEYSDKFPDIGEVIVNAGKLDEIEKAKILYRHSKNAKLTYSAKQIIQNNAHSIIWSQHYTPERIRRLVNQNFLDLKNINEKEIQKILLSSFSEPTKQMETSFKTLDGGHRWSLFALLSSDKDTSDEESYEMICPENIQLSNDEAFTPLTEAFITKETEGIAGPLQEPHYSWIHPSCRDLAIKLLTSKVSDRRQFLKHVHLEGSY